MKKPENESILTDIEEELAQDENITMFVEQNECILQLFHQTLEKVSKSKKAYQNSENEFQQHYKFAEYEFQLGIVSGIDIAIFTLHSTFNFPSIYTLEQFGCDY